MDFKTFLKQNNPSADPSKIDATDEATLRKLNPNGAAAFDKLQPVVAQDEMPLAPMSPQDKGKRMAELNARVQAGKATQAEKTELQGLVTGASNELKALGPGSVAAQPPLLTGQAAQDKIQADAKAVLAKQSPIEALGEARNPSGISKLAAGDMSVLPVDPDKKAGELGLPTAKPGNAQGFEAKGLAPAPVVESKPVPVVESKPVPVVESKPEPPATIEEAVDPTLVPMHTDPKSKQTPYDITVPEPDIRDGQFRAGPGVAEPDIRDGQFRAGPGVAAPEDVQEEKGPGVMAKLGKLAKDFGVPLLHIIQAGARGYTGDTSTPSALDKELAEKQRERERQYMAQLEEAKNKREDALRAEDRTWSKEDRTAMLQEERQAAAEAAGIEREWQAAQAQLDRDFRAAEAELERAQRTSDTAAELAARKEIARIQANADKLAAQAKATADATGAGLEYAP